MAGTGNYNDDKRQFFMDQLSVTSGNSADLERQYYIDQLSLPGSTLATKDLERLWLVSVGITEDNLQDGWVSFLKGQGYNSTVNDDQRDYFEDNI